MVLTTIGGHTLLNLVRVPNNMTTPAPMERGLIEQMEEEVREAGLGG